MKALILFSHGSVLCGSGAALAGHAERLRKLGEWDEVEVGYMNYSVPTFADTVDRCYSAGARDIVVLPFFLLPGYFVSKSLPEHVRAIEPSYPDAHFIIGEPIGFDERLADVLIESASEPIEPVNISDSMKTALVVMVHGSPKPEANEDMYRVVDVVRGRNAFDIAEIGFLECNEPSIADALETDVLKGAEYIIAVPYFLHTGTHVADDLPGLLEQASTRYPNVKFSMGRYIGTSERLTEILADRARYALATLSVF